MYGVHNDSANVDSGVCYGLVFAVLLRRTMIGKSKAEGRAISPMWQISIHYRDFIAVCVPFASISKRG